MRSGMIQSKPCDHDLDAFNALVVLAVKGPKQRLLEMDIPYIYNLHDWGEK